MKLKDGLIIVNKGGSWNSENSFITSLISIGTLSRYSHTASICSEDGRYYIYQSTFKDGVHKLALYEPWFNNAIEQNKLDVFEDENFNKTLFLEKFEKVKNSKYWFKGFFLIGFYNLFGKDFYKLNKPYTKYFCSHLTSYLHNFEKPYHLNSPATLAHTNKYKRLI